MFYFWAVCLLVLHLGRCLDAGLLCWEGPAAALQGVLLLLRFPCRCSFLCFSWQLPIAACDKTRSPLSTALSPLPHAFTFQLQGAGESGVRAPGGAMQQVLITSLQLACGLFPCSV